MVLVLVLRDLNAFPVLDTHSHTAPFQRKNWNIVAGVLFPVGIFLIFRMARFRNATKPATVETGAEIRVPLFINEGDMIEVDTRDGSYVTRK